MANYCDYEVRVKGSKKAGLMVFTSMPCLDYKDLELEERVGNSYLISFSGNCKWSVNFGVSDSLSRVNVDSIPESELEQRGLDYWGYSLRAKSEAFQCEIMVHYWSEESGFDQFDHYKNGKLLKQRKIAYNDEEQVEFDWDTLEFVGHEGEYDQSVDGEQQAENLMAALLGLSGCAAPPEPEFSDEAMDKLDEFGRQLGYFVSEIRSAAAAAGLDFDAAPIGDTGFDMYNWSFTEGKRKSVNGWSIAIPDGFTVIKSKDDRLFEAVPCGSEHCVEDEPAVQILPSMEIEGKFISGDDWFYHPYARAGLAEFVAVKNSKIMANLLGTAPEILSAGFSDVCAYIMVQDTTAGSYSYQISVLTEGKSQQLRVQTGFMLDEQKKRLNKSVIKWVETFKFDKANPSMPKQAALESDKVISELKRGVTTSFDKAVDKANNEYVAAVGARIETLKFLAEYGLLGDDAPDTVREILSRGMEVKEFYYVLADKLVEKLKAASVSAAAMKKVYSKLDCMKDALTEFTVDDTEVTVELPSKIKEIQEKWKREVADAEKLEKARAEEERRQKEELRKKKEAQRQAAEKAKQEAELARQKAEADKKAKYEAELRRYNDEHKKWEAACAAVSSKRVEYTDAAKESEKQRLERKALKHRDDAVKKADAAVKEQTERKAAAENALAALGVFKFSEKAAQRAVIEDAVKLISAAQAAVSSAEEAYEAELAAIPDKVEKQLPGFQENAAEKFRMPEEPKKPIDPFVKANKPAAEVKKQTLPAAKKETAVKKRPYVCNSRNMSTRQIESLLVKEGIYYEMKLGKQYTEEQIMQEFECIPCDFTELRIRALLSQLAAEGYIDRKIIDGVTHFYIV